MHSDAARKVLEKGCDFRVLFKLAPNMVGGWTESVLRRFTGGRDGGQPFDSAISDSAGNVYRTTYLGCGSGGFGVVYEVIP